MLGPEFIMMWCVLQNGSEATVSTNELLDCLFYSNDFYKKILKDTETGKTWSALKRGDEAEKFRTRVLNELKRRIDETGTLCTTQ